MYYLILIIFWLGSLQETRLNLEILGIEEFNGSILVAVYDSKENFLSQNVISSGQFEVKTKLVKGHLSLPFGKYAISVFQDTNNDGELNANLFGIPKEPIGFSNNVRRTFGPPKFEQAVINFDSDNQLLKIELY